MTYDLDISASAGGQDEQVARWLRLRTCDGVHTYELRRMFIGNPSQRFANIVAKLALDIVKRDERHAGTGRMGTRYWLRQHAPDDLRDAPAVKPAESKPARSVAVGTPPAERAHPADGLLDAPASPSAPSDRPSPAGSPPPGPGQQSEASTPPAGLGTSSQPPLFGGFSSAHDPYQEAA